MRAIVMSAISISEGFQPDIEQVVSVFLCDFVFASLKVNGQDMVGACLYCTVHLGGELGVVVAEDEGEPHCGRRGELDGGC